MTGIEMCFPQAQMGRWKESAMNQGHAGWVRAGMPAGVQFRPSSAGWGFPLKSSLIRRGPINKTQTYHFQLSLAEVLAQGWSSPK